MNFESEMKEVKRLLSSKNTVVTHIGKVCSGMVLVGLAACTTSAGPGVNQHPMSEKWPVSSSAKTFQAEGRLAVKLEGKGSYANFDWQNSKDVQTIEVNTPIGSTVGTLCRDARGVIAVNNKGESFEANSAEELSKQLLGFSIPLQYLPDWAAGERADAPYQILPDGSLQQFGWHVVRTTKADGSPKMLQLSGQELNIKLLFDKFNTSSSGVDEHNICEARH